MGKLPYTYEQLYSSPAVRTFNDDAREAAFLLGGIGTGNISLGARGQLRDWEIFGRPDKGTHCYMPFQFFAIRAADARGAVSRVLEARLSAPHSLSHGYSSSTAAGLPRLKGATLSARMPFATVAFCDDTLPVNVALTAFTPLIPLNVEDSSIPAAVLRYRVHNPGTETVDVSIAGAVSNLAGLECFSTEGFSQIVLADHGENHYREQPGLRGIYMDTPALPADHLRTGSMALATSETDTTCKVRWLDGGWQDGLQDFWDDFCADGKLEAESHYVQKDAKPGDGLRVGGLCAHHALAPGETHEFTFFLSWYRPNRVRSWDQPVNTKKEKCCDGGCGCGKKLVRNYYATKFADAWDAAQYLSGNLPRLEGDSRAFADALHNSTLPGVAIDAAASNITVLRSTTCFRVEDGTFYGYEGCFDASGCCDGSCTHVWNYAQTLAFLFPTLEQTMRRVEYLVETDERGSMAFRTFQALGEKRWGHYPAVDGQMGTLVRLYREWKLTGDDAFLREVWPAAVRSLEFAFEYWDLDRDGVLDGQMHNTYDIEFYGPNALSNSMFLAALLAAERMADYLGEPERAKRYRAAFENASARVDKLLYDGEYYVQRLEDVNEYRYQYGLGCLSDQLLGQTLAHVAGLGYVLPEAHVKSAAKAIFTHNFKQGFAEHHNAQRVYAINDEDGLLLCTWPRGVRPQLPFPYSDEVWTGIEYQVATHLIYEGYVDEGLCIVKAVRDRHDGYARNPWNEVECGHHYARAMASWGVLTALSGFSFDMCAGTVDFAPRVCADDFRCFFSTGKAWGIYTQKRASDGRLEKKLEILGGEGVRLA